MSCVNFQPFYVFFQLSYPAVCVVPVLKQFVNVVSVLLCCMLEFDDIGFDVVQCLFQSVALFIDLPTDCCGLFMETVNDL